MANLKQFLNLVPPRVDWEALQARVSDEAYILSAIANGNNSTQPAVVQIEEAFAVSGVGTVVAGIIMAGVVCAGARLLLGPNSAGRVLGSVGLFCNLDGVGEFIPVVVKSIQQQRRNVKKSVAGQTATFALKSVKRSDIERGMSLLDDSLNPRAVHFFRADIMVLANPVTMSINYEAVVHAGNVCSTAKIVAFDNASEVCISLLVHFKASSNPWCRRLP